MRSGLRRRALLAALVAVVALLAAAFALASATALVLPTHTLGARYSKVTQATISSTICVKGWTAKIRPPASYTNALKRAQLAEWHYADRNPAHYEEDHLGGPARLTLLLLGAETAQQVYEGTPD